MKTILSRSSQLRLVACHIICSEQAQQRLIIIVVLTSLGVWPRMWRHLKSGRVHMYLTVPLLELA